jgi:hypothetical protein
MAARVWLRNHWQAPMLPGHQWSLPLIEKLQPQPLKSLLALHYNVAGPVFAIIHPVAVAESADSSPEPPTLGLLAASAVTAAASPDASLSVAPRPAPLAWDIPRVEGIGPSIIYGFFPICYLA